MHRYLLSMLVLACACSITLAEEPRTSPAIVPGQSVADTLAILKECKVTARKEVFQETAGAKDADDFTFDLDDGALARVFFSKSKQEVTGVAILLHKKQPRGYQKWLSAKALWLVDDGSYIVHLLPQSNPK